MDDAWRKTEDDKEKRSVSRGKRNNSNCKATGLTHIKEESPEKGRVSKPKKFVVEDSGSPLKKPNK